MKGYVITVDFEIAPAHREEFLKLVIANGKASERDEPGCKRFDICVPREQPNHVFLYEIYDDEAAFKAHLEAKHFKEFAAATEQMIVGRKIVAADWVA
jgi:autoinducer 2-degrading protein